MNRQAILASAVSLVLCSLYGCAPDPTPFDPAKFQKNSRKAAESLTSAPMGPLPTTLDTTYSPIRPGQQPATQPSVVPTTGPALTESPILRMSLQEALHRAVNNNMDIRVAGYDPAINSNRVVEAQAKFDPTLFFNPYYEWRNFQNNPSYYSSTFDGSPQKDELFGASAGIRQQNEAGGSAELRYEPNFIHQFAPGNFTDGKDFDPYYSNNLVAEIKQPLLRNFGTEVNTAQITIAKINQKTSLLDLRKTAEESLFNLEQTYWQLLEAEREVQIYEELLQATIETAEIVTKRTLQDTTQLEAAQANAAVQSRRAILVRARSRVRDLSDQLKRLMNDPELPVSGDILILPATAPIQQAIHFDPQDQINQALEHRLELAQQLLKIESQSIITRVAKNNMLPGLDVVNTMTVNGAASGFTGANTQLEEARYVGDRIGFQFDIPIGNRQAKAIYQRTLLQRQQQIDAYRNLIDQVSLDVRSSMRNVSTSWDEIRANRQAVFANQAELDAIILREKNNEPLKFSFVQLKLDTQARVADSQKAEATAIATYCIAVATLERSKGTLLRYDNVLLEEDRLSVLAHQKALENIPSPLEMMPAKDTGVNTNPTSAPGAFPSSFPTMNEKP